VAQNSDMDGGAQLGLFDGERRGVNVPAKRRQAGFNNPDPNNIFYLGTRLREHLIASKMTWVFLVRDVLQGLSWEGFEQRYSLSGRAPYAPAAMMGLILYGVMQGKSSLRELERLARLDLGAVWISGGIYPDHSCLGRFFHRHEEELKGEFFDELTAEIIRRLGSKAQTLAGDGTIVEAASSRFQRIRRQAAQEMAEALEKKAQESSNDRELRRKSERATEVHRMVEERAAVRKSRGDRVDTTMGSATEPEAAVLKDKRGRVAPAYIPSVIATEDRLIVAHDVERTSEAASVPKLLEQARKVAVYSPDSTFILFDAGYNRGSVLKAGCEQDVNLLCSRGKPTSPQKAKRAFSKTDFKYLECADCYRCPAGKFLTLCGLRKDSRRDAAYYEYSSSRTDCRNCEKQDRCIPGKKEKRRRIKRYESEIYLEAMAFVHKHPLAKTMLDKRKGIVEPVFADLRGIQGLNRFRRYGLANAKLEFAVHVCAHNFRRLIAVLGVRARAAAISLLSMFAWLRVGHLRRNRTLEVPEVARAQDLGNSQATNRLNSLRARLVRPPDFAEQPIPVPL